MKLAHFLLALGLLGLLAGCAPSEDAPAGDTDEVGTSMTDDSASHDDGGAEMEMAVFRNKDGEIVCPKMGATISDPSKAVGHVDHEGVRYYICCDGCKELLDDGALAKKMAEEKFPDGKAE